MGDTDEHGLSGYSKLQKNQISVEICENLCPNLICFWGGPFDCNIPYLTSYCNSNRVDLDTDIVLKKHVEKTFVGCRRPGMMVHLTA